MQIRFLYAVAIALGCVSSVLAADDSMQRIKTAKSATALVILPNNGGSASAFCIDGTGFFATNYHVVEGIAEGTKITLVLNAGDQGEKSVSATVLRVAKEDDLAVIKAEGIGFVPLPLGTSEGLTETQPVTAFGYPFGKALSMGKGEFPSITVNLAHVTSLRRAKGKLELIQLDSQLNPGNSGGPIIDDKGSVVGVVSAGVVGAGINFAVPVSKLSALLDRPELMFTAPTIAPEKTHDPIAVSVGVVPFGKPKTDLTIEVVLATSGGTERSYPAQAAGKDTYTARIIPVPTRPAGTLPAVITFADGMIRCALEDQALRLDGKVYKFSQLNRIDIKGTGATIIHRDGTAVAGASLAVAPIKAMFGGYSLAVDATKAMSIVLTEADTGTPSVSYRVIAKSKGVVVGEIKGMLLGSPEAVAAGGDAANGGGAVASGRGALVPGGLGGWTDLLARLDTKEYTDSGTWEVRNGVLTNARSRDNEVTRITLPVKPTGDYIYDVTFVRRQGGKDIVLLFPVGGHGAAIWLGEFDGQQSHLDGPRVKGRNDIVRVMDGKPMHAELTVINKGATSEISLKLNGVQFLNWSGDPAKLQVDSSRATRDGRTLGLAACHHTYVEFPSVKVKAINGAIEKYVAGQ